MTPTEQVKMLTAAMVEHVDKCCECCATGDRMRAALAATAEPAGTCSCGFPRTAGYPQRACESCGRAATAEPAPAYSADDLRKVAEAVRGAATSRARAIANRWDMETAAGEMGDLRYEPLDLDAIIAKAVVK